MSVAYARSGRSKSPTPRLLRSFCRREYSARICDPDPMDCSTRALKFIASVGDTANPFTPPPGAWATMVRESYEELPSTESEKPDLFFASGPEKLTM